MTHITPTARQTQLLDAACYSVGSDNHIPVTDPHVILSPLGRPNEECEERDSNKTSDIQSSFSCHCLDPPPYLLGHFRRSIHDHADHIETNEQGDPYSDHRKSDCPDSRDGAYENEIQSECRDGYNGGD